MKPKPGEHLYTVVTPGDYSAGDSGYENEPLYTDVFATNRREALKLAIKSHDLSDWVWHQRGNNRNPFTGLRVHRHWENET